MDIFDEALCFAIERHSGQTRKTSDIPYILHPAEVAAIVATMTDDREVLSAAVLHDTVEDTDTTFDEIRERFGRRVELLVMTETEEKRHEQPAAETWELRKEESLIILEKTNDIAVKMLWLGDKLSNMRSFVKEYRRFGDKMWQNFNQKDPEKQAWYYRKIAECLSQLKEYDAYQEYVSLLDYIFKDYKEV